MATTAGTNYPKVSAGRDLWVVIDELPHDCAGGQIFSDHWAIPISVGIGSLVEIVKVRPDPDWS